MNPVVFKVFFKSPEDISQLTLKWPQIAFIREDSILSIFIVYLATQSAILKWNNREGRTRKGSRMVTRNIGTEIMYNMHPSKNREKYLNAFAAFSVDNVYSNSVIIAGAEDDVNSFRDSHINAMEAELLSPTNISNFSRDSPKVQEIYGNEFDIGCLLSSLAVKDL